MRILTIFFTVFSLSVDGQILNDIQSNLTWKDSIECKRIFKEIEPYDYSFVTSEVSFIEAKNSYKEIKTTYFIVGLMTKEHKACKIKIEKYDIKDFKKYNQSNSTERKYKIENKKTNFEEALSFFNYINDTGFHKLNNDSLTTRSVIKPDGQHISVSVTHSAVETVYLKSYRNIRAIRSHLSQYMVSNQFRPYLDREKYLLCVNRYFNSFWNQ
jgi:hypothetical protein